MNVGRKQTCAFSPLIVAALVEVSQENKGGEVVYFDPCFSVMILLFFVYISDVEILSNMVYNTINIICNIKQLLL